MFGIGATELVIIGIVLLIAVGPSRLPKLLKAVVSSYREFRRATRELRASTGIDEILQDEELRDLRKPIHIPELGTPKGAIAADKKGANAKKQALSYTERVQENPPEGVDLADIRDLENAPTEEEKEAIVAAKHADYENEQAIINAKLAAADEEPAPLSEEEIARRVAEKNAVREDEAEIIAAKIAAAEASEVSEADGDEADEAEA